MLSALFLLLCGYFGTSTHMALSLLTAGVGFGGLGLAGHAVNHIDLAPRFAGVLMGISNTMGTVPGIIGPVIAKAIAHSVSVLLCIDIAFYGHITNYLSCYICASSLYHSNTKVCN